MARHRIHYPPPSLRCPHCRGQSRDLFYHSTYCTRAGPRRLWESAGCGKCLSERRGTAFFNLKTPESEVCCSLDAMLRGDTQTSTSQTRRHRRETLRRWRRRAAPRARAVDEEFVADLEVRDLELDEQWSFAGKKADFADSSERGEAWWHKAMARDSRLVVEQFVSPRTPEAAERLVNRSFDRLAVRNSLCNIHYAERAARGFERRARSFRRCRVGAERKTRPLTFSILGFRFSETDRRWSVRCSEC